MYNAYCKEMTDFTKVKDVRIQMNGIWKHHVVLQEKVSKENVFTILTNQFECQSSVQEHFVSGNLLFK